MSAAGASPNQVPTAYVHQLLFGATIDLHTGFNIAPSVVANNTPDFFQYYNTTDPYVITKVICRLDPNTAGATAGALGGIKDSSNLLNVVAAGTSFDITANNIILTPALSADTSTKLWSSTTGQPLIQYVLGTPSGADSSILIWVFGYILHEGWS